MPQFSVIICSHNSAHFIQEAVDSALKQQGSLDVEVIAIDLGSVDGTPDILESYGVSVRWEGLPSATSTPQAKNHALTLARGEYVVFLEADDRLEPNGLQRLYERAKRFPPESKIQVYGLARLIDHRGQEAGVLDPWQYSFINPVAHLILNPLYPGTILYRRTLLSAVGGLDESLPHGYNYNLNLRLSLAGVKWELIPEMTCQRRIYNSPFRSSRTETIENREQYWLDFTRHQETLVRRHYNNKLPSEVRSALAKRYWALGRNLLREGQTEEARPYFREARRLSFWNAPHGHPFYRMLCRIVGPEWAEKGLHPRYLD